MPRFEDMIREDRPKSPIYGSDNKWHLFGFEGKTKLPYRSFIDDESMTSKVKFNIVTSDIATIEFTDLPTSMSTPNYLTDQAIAEASWILDLPDDWDEDGAMSYRQDALDRVREILLTLLDEACLCGITADAPDITPAASGGIDLFWDSDRTRVLINVSSERDGPVTFYCKRKGGLAAKGWILEE